MNELFFPAFADILPEDQVRLNAVRTEDFDDAPLEFWDIAGRNADNCEKLAQGVLDLLNSKRLVFDKQTQQKRPVRPSDIAILARTNKKCFDIASHLAERYIPATVASPGLMSEPDVPSTSSSQVSC